MAALFSLTLFLSATLLFLVQPMVGRMLLPLFGGTPAVWSSCMLFFQAALLLGYGYAHVAPARLGARRQALLHLGLLLLPLLWLPISVNGALAPQGDAHPAPALLRMLLGAVAVPFLLVSTSAPLLQRWFAGTTHPAARDPYFLYAASNLGSMLSLVAYPLLLEPRLSLLGQSRLWAAGYGALVLLTAACAAVLLRSPASTAVTRTGTGEGAPQQPTGEEPPPPSRGERLRWVALGLCPASLLLGVTTHLSTNIAAIPLLWIVPLGLYLLSFILVFLRRPPLPHRTLLLLLPLSVVPLSFLLAAQVHVGPALEIALHLGTFFLVAMVCHGELARRRPASRHLTSFYLFMSLGGVLGGLVNALLAPLLLRSLLEYPLVLCLSCLLVAGPAPPAAPASSPRRARLLELLPPAALGLLAVLLTLRFPPHTLRPRELRTTLSLLGHGALVLGCLVFVARRQPRRFALAIGAVVLGAGLAAETQALHQSRGFFGVLRVQDGGAGRLRQLVHGTTVHGMQRVGADGRPEPRPEPLAYYHREGPAGEVFAALAPRLAGRAIAVVGMGTGALCAYAQAGQRWTFYEIDPQVQRVAEDPRLFTYLRDCQVAPRVVIGDGRLRLREVPPGSLALLVMDAFSSDAIPMHLLSREAMAMYVDKLAPDGVLLFNISNRYLALGGVLGALGESAGLVGLQQDGPGDLPAGRFPSTWVALSRRLRDLGPVSTAPRWRPLPRRGPGAPLWTDDFSNLLEVFAWRQPPP